MVENDYEIKLFSAAEAHSGSVSSPLWDWMDTGQGLFVCLHNLEFSLHPVTQNGNEFLLLIDRTDTASCFSASVLYFETPNLFLSYFLSLCLLSFSQLVKLCIGMIDAGKAYNAANKQFVYGIRELAQQSTKDDVIEVNKKHQIWFCSVFRYKTIKGLL